LLVIAPGIQEQFGTRNDIAGTQLDIVPTIMGRLGGPVQQQCWGRDLLALDPADPGIGVIKPSGSDQTVALVSGTNLLIQPRDGAPRLYDYKLHEHAGVQALDNAALQQHLLPRLQAFLQVATQSLLSNTAGVGNTQPSAGQTAAHNNP